MEKKFGVAEQTAVRKKQIEAIASAYGAAATIIKEGVLVRTEDCDFVVKVVIKKERVDVEEQLAEIEQAAQAKAAAEAERKEKAAKANAKRKEREARKPGPVIVTQLDESAS